MPQHITVGQQRFAGSDTHAAVGFKRSLRPRRWFHQLDNRARFTAAAVTVLYCVSMDYTVLPEHVTQFYRLPIPLFVTLQLLWDNATVVTAFTTTPPTNAYR